MREYLEEDLRIEMSALQNFDNEIIKQCAEFGRKNRELGLILKYLNEI
jgi:hypothetical protein